MERLRNVVFAVVFYGLSVPVVLLAPVAALFGSKALRRWCCRWAAMLQWTARAFLRIETRVVGTIPPSPVLFAAKHESLFEAMDLVRVLDAPATVMKRELAQIPIWGWAARRYGNIVVDREASAGALRGMMRDAKGALAEKRSILIFPEGTRVPVGEAPPLVSGFAGLYRMLNLPVVPIAVKSGHVWPKKGPKHAGEVIYQMGEPIPPGLSRAEIEKRVHAAINALN